MAERKLRPHELEGRYATADRKIGESSEPEAPQVS